MLFWGVSGQNMFIYFSMVWTGKRLAIRLTRRLFFFFQMPNDCLSNCLVRCSSIFSGRTWKQHHHHRHTSVRRWRHRSARRTVGSSQHRGILLTFCFERLSWLSGPHSGRVRRLRSPLLHSTITPQCGDPAKMKWMFKEDHSLGKGVWIVMKPEMFLSCRASCSLSCFLCIDFAMSSHIGAEMHAVTAPRTTKQQLEQTNNG